MLEFSSETGKVLKMRTYKQTAYPHWFSQVACLLTRTLLRSGTEAKAAALRAHGIEV